MPASLSATPYWHAGHVITAIQSIAARNVDPADSVVISICAMEAGKMNTYNVIPRFVKMVGHRAHLPQGDASTGR